MLLDIHQSFAWFVIVGNGLAGTWSLGANWYPFLRTRALWWFIVVVEISIFIQVAMGVGMVAGQKLEAPQFHMFYGFVAIITVGLIYSYRSQMERYRYLLYGFGGLVPDGSGHPGHARRPHLTAAPAVVQRCTTGQVRVRVMPSIICTRLTTSRPSSSMVPASARTTTS